MSATHITSEHNTLAQIEELCRHPRETEWIEFKENNADPAEIGEYVSALANSAALNGKPHGYLVWGVRDGDHALVGTHFDPYTKKVSNEELENWLHRLLSPQVSLRFVVTGAVGEAGEPTRRLVMLEIGAATHSPVRFRGEEFIRVGSYKRKLKDLHEKERQLWRTFERTSFEDGIAASGLSQSEVLAQLAYGAYFDLIERPLPDGASAILSVLEEERLAVRTGAGLWSITNLGAVLFAKDLANFGPLGRKATRIIRYTGTGRVHTRMERVIAGGYASTFETTLDTIRAHLPTNEFIGEALRKSVPLVPDLTLREIVANLLIHQDFAVHGAGPLVEIFDDRIEVTNPGEPIVDVARFLDLPPRSRNEALASLLRRLNICEERGSGVDKVVTLCELYQLPPPLFEVTGSSTRVVLFGPRDFRQMDRNDRIRACYQHACLRYVNRELLTNESLRARFGFEPSNSAQASRIIRDTIDAGLLLPDDPKAGKKGMKYRPYWTATAEERPRAS